MAWVYLFVAGLFEIGWPVGLKLAESPGSRVVGILIAIVCMALSGLLLWLALRSIPIGIAYAIWTGIGATGTFIVGVLFFGDPNAVLRWVGVALIVGGIALLKVSA